MADSETGQIPGTQFAVGRAQHYQDEDEGSDHFHQERA